MLPGSMRPIQIARSQTIDLRAVDFFTAVVAYSGGADDAYLDARLDQSLGKESRRNFGAADLVWKI
jgi:PP-loop superfamily ATP-utilizing enzyme